MNDEFNLESGLNLAVAFTAWDNVKENILDPTFGSLVFKAYQWGFDQDG